VDKEGKAVFRIHDPRRQVAIVIAGNPDVTLKELMAAIGHPSPVAALRYQLATAERGKAIASYFDGSSESTSTNRDPTSRGIHVCT
jgi:hypothetical protein